jgi:hypothetical protein
MNHVLSTLKLLFGAKKVRLAHTVIPHLFSLSSFLIPYYYLSIAEYEGLSPFMCRDEVNDLKICANRNIVALRESAPEIDTVPRDASAFIDWDDRSRVSDIRKSAGLK